MKTPREILLSHHRAAEPKLDAVRRAVVGDKLNNKATKEQRRAPDLVSWFLGCSNKLWQELFLPSRFIWGSLAAVWLLIFAVNVAQREPAPAGHVVPAPAMMSFREQQRWMNELFAERVPPTEAEPAKSFAPKPRTEIYHPITA